jgi:hypothetical protein
VSSAFLQSIKDRLRIFVLGVKGNCAASSENQAFIVSDCTDQLFTVLVRPGHRAAGEQRRRVIARRAQMAAKRFPGLKDFGELFSSMINYPNYPGLIRHKKESCPG